MLKVELHAHTADDPVDRIPHTAHELIDRAAALGYQALAITLHEKQADIAPLQPYAAERGVVLIPGIERSICGCHVLLLNYSPAAERVVTFDDLADLRRRERGLVVAPHPYFPAGSCLGTRLDQHASLFDAVEWHGLFTRAVNFNRQAWSWAKRHEKPIVGNNDVHRLYQLGTSYSLVDAEPDATAIVEAVRAGRVRVQAQPVSALQAARIVCDLFGTDYAVKFGLLSGPGPQLGTPQAGVLSRS